MAELYSLCIFMVEFLGPLMVACLVLMYVFTAKNTGRAPGLGEVMLKYVRYNMEKRRHAGLLTYLFILSFIFFILSVTGLVTGYLLK